MTTMSDVTKYCMGLRQNYGVKQERDHAKLTIGTFETYWHYLRTLPIKNISTFAKYAVTRCGDDLWW